LWDFLVWPDELLLPESESEVDSSLVLPAFAPRSPDDSLDEPGVALAFVRESRLRVAFGEAVASEASRAALAVGEADAVALGEADTVALGIAVAEGETVAAAVAAGETVAVAAGEAVALVTAPVLVDEVAPVVVVVCPANPTPTPTPVPALTP